ncbi:MAG: Rne/Rng family ribonuclease [Puniceicoccales bacterium]|jgi:ribonuclease G|nr:Rne/Rng family ribonuclease [Puniceicoccales bacterium]
METLDKNTEINCELEQELIKNDATERARQQPILRRIIKALSKGDKVFRELVVDVNPMENRVALLEDGILENFEFDRYNEEDFVGAIFKGKIQNIEPGLKAMFVDIGQGKNAFLHYWDMLPAANDSQFEIVRHNNTTKPKKIELRDIPQHYPIGTDIMVQVSKGQIGSKGPRVTTSISLPGRCIVLMPFSGECGISKKIEDSKERLRLKDILNRISIPDGMGVIIRTAGIGKKIRHFVRDLHILLKEWQDILEKYQNSKRQEVLYMEPRLLERTVRDFLTDDIDRVIANDEESYNFMLKLVGQVSPRSKAKIFLFSESIPIFERFNVERQIERTFKRCVPLPCGGEIVIHETEALTSIDVNTGTYKVNENESKNYIASLNREAAKEITRQLRLRNIGGLIVIDFIDMKNKRDRIKLHEFVRNEMTRDRAKCHVLPISQLGLMEISRQRHSQSNSSELRSSCPYCNGDGFIKSALTMCSEIYRSILNYIKNSSDVAGMCIKVCINPEVLDQLKRSEKFLFDLEQKFGVKLSFVADTTFHIERYRIAH